jgi:Zn-dependent metalloprotease
MSLEIIKTLEDKLADMQKKYQETVANVSIINGAAQAYADAIAVVKKLAGIVEGVVEPASDTTTTPSA